MTEDVALFIVIRISPMVGDFLVPGFASGGREFRIWGLCSGFSLFNAMLIFWTLGLENGSVDRLPPLSHRRRHRIAVIALENLIVGCGSGHLADVSGVDHQS